MNRSVASPSHSQTTQLFDNLVASLRTHQLQLETKTAPTEIEHTYKVLMGNNTNDVFRLGKEAAQQYFVSQIILDYLKHLDIPPIKLAFDFNDSEVLVWAEIADNDEALEKALLRAESKINAKYHPYGFDMETMIVEHGDGLTIPNHYRVFKAD